MKPPVWFWVVAVLALLWMLMGVGSYLYQVTLTPEAIAALPRGQAELIRSTPSWVWGAFAIATWGGLLGAIALLLRSRWSRPLLQLSVVAAIVQFGYIFLVGRGFELVGTEGAIFPAVIIVIGLVLAAFALFAGARGWLR